MTIDELTSRLLVLYTPQCIRLIIVSELSDLISSPHEYYDITTSRMW